MLGIDRPQPAERRRERIPHVGYGALGGPALRDRHHEMAARDKRLLVCRGHDLPGLEGGDDGPEADDTAGANDHDIDVVAGREGDERRLSELEGGTRGEFRRERPVRFREDDGRRPQPPGLLGEERAVATGGERHDAERGITRKHVNGLPADRAGRAEQSDTEVAPPRPRQRNAATTYRNVTGAANRNESIRSSMPP